MYSFPPEKKHKIIINWLKESCFKLWTINILVQSETPGCHLNAKLNDAVLVADRLPGSQRLS